MLPNIMAKSVLCLSIKKCITNTYIINERALVVTPMFVSYLTQTCYSRWAARKPSKVFFPEEQSSDAENEEPKKTKDYSNKHKPIVDKMQQHFQTVKPVLTVDGKEFKTLDEKDGTFSNLMMQATNRNQRKKNNLMILEGKRLNQDAIQAGLKPKKLFFTQLSFLSEAVFPPDIQVPLYKIPYKTMKLWSKLETPPGIVGFYNIPKAGEVRTSDTLPVTCRVLCDNVRDPGNMGAILRVAAAVGCAEVILMSGCTDPWDSKVLRSASGGHFHIPIKTDLTWHELEEVLNPTESVFVADSVFNRTQHHSQSLPQVLYYDPKFSKLNSIVVIIGGETEGVSDEALSLASSRNGSRVYIPLSNGVESLNSGSALSVLLFEIKRQLMLSNNVKVGKPKSTSDAQDFTDVDIDESRTASSGG